MNEFDAAWLAGFLDGEGHISVVRRRNYYVPTVNVTNTNKDQIDNVCRVLDEREIEYCICYDRREGNRKPAWTVRLESKVRVPQVLKLVLPYLIGKKHVAEKVLAWCEYDGRRTEMTTPDLALLTGIRELNQRGNEGRVK